MAKKNAPDGLGLICANCGGNRFKTRQTIPLKDGRIRRYRRCKKCKLVIRTHEARDGAARLFEQLEPKSN